jgi:hypothetical protein
MLIRKVLFCIVLFAKLWNEKIFKTTNLSDIEMVTAQKISRYLIASRLFWNFEMQIA